MDSEKKEKPWTGFQPGRYFFNLGTIIDLPLRRLKKGESGIDSDAGTATTIRRVLGEIGEAKDILIEGTFGGLSIQIGKKEILLGGPNFSLEIMGLICNLLRESRTLDRCALYWYDSDWVKTDPHESYHFFIVYENSIIDESRRFSRHSNSGFVPNAFQLVSEDDNPWNHAGDWREAENRYWYRKFYRETMTGQLMVLRPDEPQLFYYPEGRQGMSTNEREFSEDIPSNVPVGTDKLIELESISRRLQVIIWLLVGIIALLAWKRQ